MTRRTVADYPTLGFVPCPGDTYEADQLATTLSSVKTVLNEISNVLHGADEGEWRGEAARAFRDLLDDDVRPKIDTSCDAFEGAHRALSGWSLTLADHQRRADDLEQRALEAQQRAEQAASTLDGLPAARSPFAPPPTDPADQRAEERDDRARGDAERAQGAALDELEQARADARTLQEQFEEAGRTAGAGLEDAISIAPSEPGWFDSLVDSLGDFFDAIVDVVKDIGDLLMQALEVLAPYLAILGDIAGLLSTVLGLLAFIPGLQFLAPIALGLAVAALALGYLAGVGESGSLLQPLTTQDFWLDAAGVATGGLGAFASRGLTTAARLGGNTRMVPQLVGPALEIPHSMFAMAATGRAMSTSEGLWRLANLRGIYAGLGSTGFSVPSTISDISNIFTLDYRFTAPPRTTVGDLSWSG